MYVTLELLGMRLLAEELGFLARRAGDPPLALAGATGLR